MNGEQRSVVAVIGILAAFAIVLTIAITVSDVNEKRTAFKQGLCQTTQPGSSSWFWSTCPKK